MIPLITAMPSQNVQYALISCGIWSLFSGHPTMIYPISHCKWTSCAVARCICGTDMDLGMFVIVCIASTFMSIPCISASLFSEWLCLDSQSVMKSCGPGLYIILTWNWFILRRMHFILCDRVATSFWEYCYWGFMISYNTYLPSKPIMGKSFKTMQYTQWLSFAVTVSLFCTGQAFACKMWLASEWCCLVLCPFSMSFHLIVCNRVAPSPILDAWVSRYRGFCFIIKLHA